MINEDDLGSGDENEFGFEESKGQNNTTVSVIEEVLGGTESDPEKKH